MTGESSVSVKITGSPDDLVRAFAAIAGSADATADEIKKKFAEASIEVDALKDSTDKASTSQDSLLTKLSRFGNVVTGLNQGSQLMDRFRGSTDQADQSMGKLSSDGGEGMSKLKLAAVALLPALSGIGQVGAAVGVGLVGTFGAAAGGLAIFKLASGAVTDQFKTDAGAVLTSWQTAMAPFVQGVYTRAVGLLKQGLTDITPVVKPVSDALQGVEKDFQAVLGSTAVTNGFKVFGQEAAQAITAIGPALANIVPAALNLFVAMNPLVAIVEQFVKGIGPQLPALAASLQGPFQSLAATFTALGPSVSNIFHEIGSTVGQLLAALEPLAPILLNLLDNFLGIVSADVAPVVTTIAQSFGRILSAVTPLLGPIGQVVQILAGALSGALVTVTNALVPVISLLAKDLGPILVPLAQLVGAFAETIGKSLAGSISAFLPIFQQLAPIAAAFASALASSLLPVMNALIPAIQNMTKYTFVFPALLNGLVSLLPAIQSILPAVAQLIGPAAQLFTDVLAKGGIVLENLIPPLVAFASQIIAGIGPAISDLAPVVGTLAASFGTLVGKIATDLLPAIQPLVPIIVNLANNVGGALLNAFTQIGPLIGDLAPIIADLIANGLNEMVGVFQILAPILGAILAPALQIVAALFQALQPLIPAIEQTIQALIPAVVEVATLLGQSLGGILKQLAPIMVQLINDGLTPILKAILPLLPSLAQLAGALLPIMILQTRLWAAAVAAILPVLAPVIVAVAQLAALLIGGITVAISAVVGVLTGLVQWIDNTTTHLSGFKQAFTAAASWVGQKVGDIVGFFVGLPGKIINTIGSVLVVGQHIVGDIVSGLAGAATGIWNWFKNLPGTIGSTISGLAHAFTSLGGQIINDIVSGIGGGAGAIGGALKGLLKSVVSSIPGVSAIASLFAEGGIVTKPTLGLVGEAGYPEAIIPLTHGLTGSGFVQAVNEFAGGGSVRPYAGSSGSIATASSAGAYGFDGGTTTLSITIPSTVAVDGQKLAQTVTTAQLRLQKGRSTLGFGG